MHKKQYKGHYHCSNSYRSAPDQRPMLLHSSRPQFHTTHSAARLPLPSFPWGWFPYSSSTGSYSTQGFQPQRGAEANSCVPGKSEHQYQLPEMSVLRPKICVVKAQPHLQPQKPPLWALTGSGYGISSQ